MYCKKCGKALGTERGICPFCGAALSEDQMKTFQESHQNDREVKLLTERYGEKAVYYEKSKNKNRFLGLILVLAVLLVIIIFVFCFALGGGK